jgi:hypothetical protein
MAAAMDFKFLAAESVSKLRSSEHPDERALELGKIQNLRIAAQRLNGLQLKSGDEFSFWKLLGKCKRRQGYVLGRQLQEGCLIPALGGGICQLSNALYDVALQVGAEIVERHAHSRVIPGSAASRDRDATVAWNYIDLRFKVPADCRLTVALTTDSLVVQLHSREEVMMNQARPARKPLRLVLDPVAHSCGLCDQHDCHLHQVKVLHQPSSAAFLVDDVWPEFLDYLDSIKRPTDSLLIPIDGHRWNIPRYNWTTAGYTKVSSAPLHTIARSVRSRQVADQGAQRQTANLKEAAALARELGRRIPFHCEHLVVAQTLLPFLWELGFLGGRTFDVLMTRLPMAELQSTLDHAAELHSQSSTLGDFRAPDRILQLEVEALVAASSLITPHSFIARNDPRKKSLNWSPGVPKQWTPGDRVVFPGPTVGRKGAYELREAVLKLDLQVVLLGANLEDANFWKGVRTTRPSPSDNWLEGAMAVVQPAYLEDKPRRLLIAIASGCPVICTPQCGLGGVEGVTEVPCGHVGALIKALGEWRQV